MVMAPRLHFMSGVREERNGRGKKKTGREKAPGVKRGILGVWLIIRGFAQF